MTKTNGNSGKDELALFQKRIDAAREKMAAARDQLRRREARENERLFKAVGEACCKAAQRPEFGAALKEVLEAETDQRVQTFLHQKGLR